MFLANNDDSACFLLFIGENASLGCFLCASSNCRCSTSCFWRRSSCITYRSTVGNMAYWGTSTHLVSVASSSWHCFFKEFGGNSPCSCANLCQSDSYNCECACTRLFRRRVIILGWFELSHLGTTDDNVHSFDWHPNYISTSFAKIDRK